MDISDNKGKYYYCYDHAGNGIRIYGDTLSGLGCEENGPDGNIIWDVRRRGPRRNVPGEEAKLPKDQKTMDAQYKQWNEVGEWMRGIRVMPELYCHYRRRC